MFHIAITHYKNLISYISVGIWWFGTAGFQFFFSILHFILFVLNFVFCTIDSTVFLKFFKICSSYVNGTFMFTEILLLPDTLTTSFSSALFSSGVSVQRYHFFSILLFLGDFTDGRLLHDVEVHPSMGRSTLCHPNYHLGMKKFKVNKSSCNFISKEANFIKRYICFDELHDMEPWCSAYHYYTTSFN